MSKYVNRLLNPGKTTQFPSLYFNPVALNDFLEKGQPESHQHLIALFFPTFLGSFITDFTAMPGRHIVISKNVTNLLDQT